MLILLSTSESYSMMSALRVINGLPLFCQGHMPCRCMSQCQLSHDALLGSIDHTPQGRSVSPCAGCTTVCDAPSRLRISLQEWPCLMWELLSYVGWWRLFWRIWACMVYLKRLLRDPSFWLLILEPSSSKRPNDSLRPTKMLTSSHRSCGIHLGMPSQTLCFLSSFLSFFLPFFLSYQIACNVCFCLHCCVLIKSAL